MLEWILTSFTANSVGFRRTGCTGVLLRWWEPGFAPTFVGGLQKFAKEFEAEM
jgi:hypothetical protein